MWTQKSIAVEKPVQKKNHNISKKDYQKIIDWFSAYKLNYFSQNVPQSLLKQQTKEVMLRIYFSQIYLSEEYLNLNYGLIKNLADQPMSIIAEWLKSQQKYFSGKSYQNKHIACQYNIQSKRLNFKNQINLLAYCTKGKNQQILILFQFSLTDNQGQQFRLGRVSLNLNSLSVSQIVQLTLTGKNGQKIGSIHSIIQKDILRQIRGFLPPNVIIDNMTLIPGIKQLQMKRKSINLQEKSKMVLQNIRIEISNFAKLKQKILKNNPFFNEHPENVQFFFKKFTLKLGIHNSWKFIESDKQIRQIQLIQDPSFISMSILSEHLDNQNDKMILKFKNDKQKLLKTYFQCQKCVFLSVLRVQVEYKFDQYFQTTELNLGWCVIANRLHQNKINFSSYLQQNKSLPGMQMQVRHQGMKLTIQIQNPQYKKYNQKFDDDQLQIEDEYLFFGINTKQEQLFKPSFVKRFHTETNQSKDFSVPQNEEDQLNKELQTLINQVQKQIENKQSKIIIKGHLTDPEYINSTERDLGNQKDWENILNYQNKILKIGVKVISLIPNTDETTFLKGRYYLPKSLNVKIHLLRKIFDIQAQIRQNCVSFNIPCFLKSKKQMTFTEVEITNKNQLSKLFSSLMMVTLTDLELNKFYAKGTYLVSKIINQKDSFKIGVQLQHNDSYMGQLGLQVSLSVRNKESSYKRQIQMIQKDKIIHSLPMKERMMMRIANYNKSNKEMQNTAISTFRENNRMSVINKITSQQMNNFAQISYELGEPSYFLLQFSNVSSSENNSFTLFFKNCDYVEIITNQKEYKQICLNNNFDIIPYHKINFEMGNLGLNGYDNPFYSCKIVHNLKVGILIKVYLQQWNSHIKQYSNFSLNILRNTMLTATYKFKLHFKQPIIHENISFYQINNQNNTSKGFYLHLPKTITQRYKQLISFSKQLSISKKNQLKIVLKQKFKSPYKFEVLVQGKLFDSQNTQIILIEINLLDGEFFEVELGQITHKRFIIDGISNPELMNKILVLYSKNVEDTVMMDKSVYIMSGQTMVNFRACSFGQGMQNFVLSFFDLEGKLRYQYLLKVVTRIKRLIHQIFVQNFIGQRLGITLKNPYMEGGSFYLYSNSQSVCLVPKMVKLQFRGSQRISVQLVNILCGKTYITIYDDLFKIVDIYELIVNSNTSDEQRVHIKQSY